MKILLPKNHKYKILVKENGVEVANPECPDYACFRPHNFKYARADGKIMNNWTCRTRDLRSCPKHPKKENK